LYDIAQERKEKEQREETDKEKETKIAAGRARTCTSPTPSHPPLSPTPDAGQRSVLQQLCTAMVVRSAQKGQDDIQRIWDAMEGHKPVVTDSQRELIIKQANIIGEDGVAIVEDIKDAAVSTVSKLLPADIFRMIESCMASLSQKARTRMQSDAITREKEPERLKQIEAIREQATMLHGSRLNKDKLTE
jgi:hypothetical protein